MCSSDLSPAQPDRAAAPEADGLARHDGTGEIELARAARSQDLLTLAGSADLPPLLLLAIASEQEALVKSLAELSRLRRC